MTLGERITQKRKEKGMSQEELGSILNVSRQTVHKWETDQAIPELNKLLALAEEFEVKVGWLIAEEENDGNVTSESDTSEKIIELVQQNDARNKKQLRNILIAAAGLFVVITGFLYIRFNSLEQKYQSMSDYIVRNNALYLQKLNNITADVSEMLNTYNSVTADVEISLDYINLNTNSIVFSVSVLPKTYYENMRVIYHVSSGSNKYDFETIEQSDKYFFTKVEIPLYEDNIQISAELINGEISESTIIYSLNGLLTSTFPYYDFVYYFRDSVNKKYTGFVREYFEVIEQSISDNSYLYYPDQRVPRIIKMEAFLTEDGVKIADYTYDKNYTASQNSYDDDSITVYWHYFKRPENISLVQGREYVEHFIATDEYGRQIEITFDNDSREVKYYFGR